MKKKIFIITFVIILVGSMTALANYTYEQNEKQKYEETTAFEIQQVNETEADRITRMADYIKEIETNVTRVNELIFEYAYLVQIYNPTYEQMEYIDSLIYSGADIEDVLSIHKFWLTTNDDISIIGEIYALKDNINKTHWIEEAFNLLTENRHGVLDMDGVKEYTDKGVQLADIHTANELCRSGAYTINEILDMRVNKVSWDEIIINIESVNTRTANVEEATVILAALDMSQKTDVPVSNYIMNQDAVESISGKSEDVNAKIEQGLFETLTSLAVLIDPIAGDENNYAFVREIKDRIIENGISENEIDTLMDEGFMLMNILNASEMAKINGTPIREVLNNGGDF